MYSTCLYCTKDLGANEVLETLPIGRRIAFDAAQGRLWVVCGSCGKWNLVPFDTRLETIDQCEHRFRDTNTRFSTDNIGLARVPEGLELVRIGQALRPEFAAWRYGAQYRRRRRINYTIAAAGTVGTIVAAAAMESALIRSSLVLGLAGLYLPGIAWAEVQTRRRRIVTRLAGAVAPIRLGAGACHSMHLQLDQGEMTLSFNPDLTSAFRKRTVQVTGPAARLLARRVLGRLNERVGSSNHLAQASSRIERGDVALWLDRLARSAPDLLSLSNTHRLRLTFIKSELPARSAGFASGLRVSGLVAADRLAVEMWLSEEDEARALRGELKLLERQWQEAEQLAKLADALTIDHSAGSGN